MVLCCSLHKHTHFVIFLSKTVLSKVGDFTTFPVYASQLFLALITIFTLLMDFRLGLSKIVHDYPLSFFAYCSQKIHQVLHSYMGNLLMGFRSIRRLYGKTDRKKKFQEPISDECVFSFVSTSSWYPFAIPIFPMLVSEQ